MAIAERGHSCPQVQNLTDSNTQRKSPRSTRILLLCVLLISVLTSGAAQIIQTDICVHGGTAGGVVAAVEAARLGKQTVLLEFGSHLGGMTSGGLGQTDIGNKAAIGGI